MYIVLGRRRRRESVIDAQLLDVSEGLDWLKMLTLISARDAPGCPGCGVTLEEEHYRQSLPECWVDPVPRHNSQLHWVPCPRLKNHEKALQRRKWMM